MPKSRKGSMKKVRRGRTARRAYSRRSRKQCGGAEVFVGSPLNDPGMALGQKDNMSQGQQFQQMHKTQHGGAATMMAPGPVSAITGSVLGDSAMVASARTGPLDVAMQYATAQGQKGGYRRAKGKKAKKSKSRKSRKVTRRRRVLRGGAWGGSTGSPVTSSPMLLPAGLEKSAQLNHDWDAAKNPNYWAPK
jgi:hypothetical protein